MVRQGHPLPSFDARPPTNIFSPAFTISCHAHALRATVVQSLASPNNARFPSRRACSQYFVPPVPPAGCLNSTRWRNWLPSKRTRNPSKRKAGFRIDASRLSHFVFVRASSCDSARYKSFFGRKPIQSSRKRLCWVRNVLYWSAFGDYSKHPYSSVSSTLP